MLQDIGVIFLLVLITVSSYFNGQNLGFYLALLAIFISALLIRERQRRQRQDFVKQLKNYSKELRAGGTIIVHQLLLRHDTPVTSYKANVGMLISSVLIESNYSRVDHNKQLEAYGYSLISFLSGWWSLPAGPLITLGILKQNLSGGEKVTVGQLIDMPTPEKRQLKIPIKKSKRINKPVT